MVTDKMVEALQEFAKWAIREGAFQAADLDGLSIQEKAQELGLIEPTIYDPAKHGPSDCAEPGGEWFIFTAALAETAIATRSALVAPPAQEAVGYLVKGFDGEPFYSPRKEPYDQQGHAIVPVYAAPPAVPEGMVLVPFEFLKQIRGWLPADGMNNVSNGFIATIDALTDTQDGR